MIVREALTQHFGLLRVFPVGLGDVKGAAELGAGGLDAADACIAVAGSLADAADAAIT